MPSTLIRKGILVDGTGAPRRQGDLLIEGGRIRAIDAPGAIPSEGVDRVIEAEERIVTPGFIDAHTHYDGQATWDGEMAPSVQHGITTLVIGNCGVGFAPVRPEPEERQWLIELMEGVEDIPGAALAEGLDWSWESFGDYLEALERRPHAVDIAAQVAHGAVRAYVMGRIAGNGGNDDPTPEQVERMAQVVKEGVRAGAIAFSTNRIEAHRSVHGEAVPGTYADASELRSIMRAALEAGEAGLQVAPAGGFAGDAEAPVREHEMCRQLSLETGCRVFFGISQTHSRPEQWRLLLELTEKANAAGARLHPAVPGRPISLLTSFDAFNIYGNRPSYQEVADLPIEERVKQLRDPARRARILAEPPESINDKLIVGLALSNLGHMFELPGKPLFEPGYDESLAAAMERAGRTDGLAALYDAMCDVAEKWGGRGFLHMLFTGYADHDLEALREMMVHPDSVVSVGDGGAHVRVMCDAGYPTFLLQHFARDRTRGPRIPLEEVVRILTSEPAAAYRFDDRGRLAVGMRADVNVIDHERLQLEQPRVARDLPSGAARLMQDARGYEATLVAGELVRLDDRDTGARPGRIVRG